MSLIKFLPIMSISIALSLILSYIEFLLPSIGVPGVKLGLANLIILMLLIKYPLKVPAAVNILRILLAGFMFTGPIAMMFSLAGGLSSMLIMKLAIKLKVFSNIGVSVAGSCIHNFAQLIVAIVILLLCLELKLPQTDNPFTNSQRIHPPHALPFQDPHA